MNQHPDGRIRVPKTSELVADELRQRVVNRAIRPGDTLPHESDMVEEFRVSRPTLREALRILESEGLIEIRRGARGGARVVPPTVESMARQAYTVLAIAGAGPRDAFEGLVELELAALRTLVAADAPEARAILTELQHGVEPPLNWPGADAGWHSIMMRLGNASLTLARQINAGVLGHQGVVIDCPAGPGDRVHTDIVAAVLRGRSELAQRKLRAHLEELAEPGLGEAEERLRAAAALAG